MTQCQATTDLLTGQKENDLFPDGGELKLWRAKLDKGELQYNEIPPKVNF